MPFPSSGDPPHPGIEPESPTLAGRFFTVEPPAVRGASNNPVHSTSILQSQDLKFGPASKEQKQKNKQINKIKFGPACSGIIIDNISFFFII